MRLSWSHPLVHGALIVVLAGVVYANALDGAFHLDDFYRVQGNPEVQRFWPPWRHFVDPRTMSTLPRITQFRPLLPLSLSVDHAMFGHNLVAYHLTNLLLLALCGLLAHRLCAQLLRAAGHEAHAPEIALFASLVFVAHPVSGIPVNYIGARDLLLMELFLLACLTSVLGLERASSTRARAGLWALSLVALALSLLAKTNAVVAPLLVLALELTVHRQRLLSLRPYLRALPFAGVVAGFFAYTEWGLGFSDLAHVSPATLSPWSYGLTQARLHLLHYGRNALFPFAMHPDPQVPLAQGPLEPGVLAGLALVAATLFLALWLRRRRPLLCWCILAYWILLLPTSSVVPLHHLAVDYRPLPSSLFLWLALALVLRGWLGSWSRLALGVLVIYLGAAALYLNRSWSTEETLWRHSVARGGGALAHHNLAMSLPDARQRIPLLRKALALSPSYVLAHLNLGRALVQAGQRSEGVQHVQRALALNPGWAQIHYWAGRTYAELGMTRQAAEQHCRAAELEPHSVAYAYEAALALQLAGDTTGSLPLLERLRQREPHHRETGFLYGWALQRAGRLEDAVAAYRAFLARSPGHLQARFNLAHALLSLGRCPQAIPQLEAVLRLQPDHAAARLHLERCRGR